LGEKKAIINEKQMGKPWCMDPHPNSLGKELGSCIFTHTRNTFSTKKEKVRGNWITLSDASRRFEGL
jgi:hypothetical protein